MKRRTFLAGVAASAMAGPVVGQTAGRLRMGYSVTGGGIVLPNIAPVANWRVPVTAAYDSLGDAALVNALIAAGGNNSRPTYPVVGSSTRTIACRLGAIDAPGGIFSFACDSASPTVAIAYSDNSTNGTDGTWTAIPFSLVSPTAFFTGRRQYVNLPAFAAGRWVRLVITAPATGTPYNIYPLLHQLQADPLRNDAILIIGASQTTNGFLSVDYEAAVMSVFPTSDPIAFNYGEAGASSPAILANATPAKAAFGGIARRVYIDCFQGNDITGAQPRSDDTAQFLADLRARTASVIAAFAGYEIFMSDNTFREYAGVTPTTPDDGSLPYNQTDMWPVIQANAPSCFDSDLGIPRIALYAWGLFNRNYLQPGDPVHYTSAGYASYRAEIVRTMEGRVRNNVWPDSYPLMVVKRLEAERLFHLKREAGFIVASLPASLSKAALQARIDAVTSLLPSRIKIDQAVSSSKVTPGWNTTARITTTLPALTDMVTEDGWPTAMGLILTNAATITASTGTQGAPVGADFPDVVIVDHITDQTDSIGLKFTGVDATERITFKPLASRSDGTGTATRLQDFTIQGVTRTVEVMRNLTVVPDFGTSFAPISGEIEMTCSRGVGNTVAVYVNAIILEVRAA